MCICERAKGLAADPSPGMKGKLVQNGLFSTHLSTQLHPGDVQRIVIEPPLALNYTFYEPRSTHSPLATLPLHLFFCSGNYHNLSCIEKVVSITQS